MHFVRDETLLEAVASSLTELFSPVIIGERVAGMLAGYAFVTRETLAYFDKRPPQARRDSDFALDYVGAMRPRRSSSRLCSRRSSSSATSCGRSSTRSITPMWRPGTCRRGRSFRRTDMTDVPRRRLRGRKAAPAARRAPHAQRSAGRMGACAPERVFKADAIAVEILKRCTGEATRAAIVDDLAATFNAPRERILTDVTALLRGLADKRLLEL